MVDTLSAVGHGCTVMLAVNVRTKVVPGWSKGDATQSYHCHTARCGLARSGRIMKLMSFTPNTLQIMPDHAKPHLGSSSSLGPFLPLADYFNILRKVDLNLAASPKTIRTLAATWLLCDNTVAQGMHCHSH